MIRQVQYPSYSMTPLDRVSWGAIWSGAFVSLAAMACLSLFTVGVGLAAVPAGGSPAALSQSLGAGGAAWLWFCGIVSFYLGGWVTGHLTHTGSEVDNGLHGLVSWSLATIGLLIVVGLTVGGAAGLASSLGPVLGISRAGFALISPVSGSGAAFYGFVMLLTEGAASVYGARVGTRIYRPVGITGSVTPSIQRERDVSSTR